MSDLLSLLGLGAAGLSAQHTGVSVASNNAANVNTLGYSRQRVDLRAELAAPLVGGVRSLAPDRYQDLMLASRERDAAGSLGSASAQAPALLDLEARIDGAGESIDARIAALWAGLERVSAMPTDALLRDAAIDAATNLADGMAERAAAIDAARGDADARVRDHTAQASAIAQELAKLNKQITIDGDPVLRDRRDLAAKQLAELIGGSGRIDPDGRLRWVLPDGGVLVDGNHAASLEAMPDPATGYRRVELVDGGSRRDVTTSLVGGRLAGEITFRDGDAAAAAADLDQLAFDLTTSVNAVHLANAGLDGVSGRPLFTPLAGPAGAATAIAVDPAVIANPDQLATAAVGAGPGDNRGALALLGLREQRVASGGTQTLTDAAIDLIGSLGRRAHESQAETDRATLVSDHLGDLRDAISGVDLDEEMSNLVKFQHGAEAMTRFLSAVDGMLGDMLARL